MISKKIFFLFIAILITTKLFSQSVVHVETCPDELKWTPTKAPLAPGAEVTVLEGDPKASGHFTMRVKMPPHYMLAPHSHPVDERTTVIAGIMNIGSGEVVDTSKSTPMTAGCFYVNPAGVVHYAFTGDVETIVQLSTNGPWGFKFLEKKEK